MLSIGIHRNYLHVETFSFFRESNFDRDTRTWYTTKWRNIGLPAGKPYSWRKNKKKGAKLWYFRIINTLSFWEYKRAFRSAGWTWTTKVPRWKPRPDTYSSAQRRQDTEFTIMKLVLVGDFRVIAFSLGLLSRAAWYKNDPCLIDFDCCEAHSTRFVFTRQQNLLSIRVIRFLSIDLKSLPRAVVYSHSIYIPALRNSIFDISYVYSTLFIACICSFRFDWVSDKIENKLKWLI